MMTIPVVWLYSKLGYNPDRDFGGWLLFAIIGDTVWLSVAVYHAFT